VKFSLWINDEELSLEIIKKEVSLEKTLISIDNSLKEINENNLKQKKN